MRKKSGTNQKIDFKALGEAVRNKRKRLGLSLSDVGRQTGTSASTLGRIENSTGSPDADTLAAVCEWLDIPVERFFLKKAAEAAFYYPNAPLPEIVEAICVADKNLSPKDARKLSAIFRTTYEQFTEK